jgi:thiol-disulfide isomerase/thioredoxin
MKKYKWLSGSNIFTALMAVFIIAMFINPQIKGTLMQGLMKIGLFQPDVPSQNETETAVAANIKKDNSSILFKDTNGAIVNLSDLKGKAVFINFWATWCPPCVGEMPSINQLYEKYKDNKNIVFLMVDSDGDPIKSQKFMDKNNYSLPIYTLASAIPSSYVERSLPTTLLINKKGEIVFKHEGGADYSNKEFQDYLVKLSQE